MCLSLNFKICSIAIDLGRVIHYFYGAQVDSAQTFLMWSALGGDVWCNQVTSLHEENQPMFNLKFKLFSVADRCLKKLV